MVFLTPVFLIRHVRPDRFWKVQQQMRFSWHLRSRARNCHGLGMTVVNKALMKSFVSNKLRMKQMTYLWLTRIDAGVMEHGMTRYHFLEGLQRANILLDKKVLSELAIYEPRTFESLTEIAGRTMEDTKTQLS